MRPPLLSLRNATLKIPGKESPILDALSLDVFSGDQIILLGSNGSGKSSLIKSINGLAQLTSGEILFREENVGRQTLSQRAQWVATLTQDLNLSTFSALTVLQNCEIALHRNKRAFFSLSTKEERQTISAYLAEFNPRLCEKLGVIVATLSGGERQTLAFAMNLYSAPALLLLDEHTSALDPLMAEKLMQLTCSIAAAKGIATLIATHDLDDALRYGNRLIAMKQGKIILDVSGSAKSALSRTDLLSYY